MSEGWLPATSPGAFGVHVIDLHGMAQQHPQQEFFFSLVSGRVSGVSFDWEDSVSEISSSSMVQQLSDLFLPKSFPNNPFFFSLLMGYLLLC